MPADERFVFRRYRPGDESSIVDLFTRSFGGERTLEHWRWKYADNPFGNAHVGLAVEGDRVVAQYGGYAVPFWYDRRDLEAHHIADIMSDPAVRHIGRGPTSIFARTAAQFYGDFCENRIAFNYGFSTATSRAFGNRFLGVHTVEPVPYRRRTNVDRISRLQRWLSGYRLEIVREVGQEFDELFRSVAPSYRFLVRRDAAYIRWRYLTLHEQGYFVIAIRRRERLVGWSAFRIREDKLVWGDALFSDAAAVE
ncbi:MAG TPA: GNAT family N-acetyltransferase, partial [Thermoanaerobaculia bacterium]|nr:GNAT family N-acetyltransferase [Thermoanaerobaculia bacterium]